MKNKLLLLIAVIALGILPVVSFAETAASDANEKDRNTIKGEIDAKKESIKNSVEERRQNAINKIKERLNQFVKRVRERFDAAVGRLNVLVQRIESRIAKIEARNIDETEAKNLLAVAKTKIETAKASIALIPTDIASVAASTTASTTASAIKKAFETTKAQIEKAKQDLKDAHAALIDVVNSLKPGDNKLRNATTTAEN